MGREVKSRWRVWEGRAPEQQARDSTGNGVGGQAKELGTQAVLCRSSECASHRVSRISRNRWIDGRQVSRTSREIKDKHEAKMGPDNVRLRGNNVVWELVRVAHRAGSQTPCKRETVRQTMNRTISHRSRPTMGKSRLQLSSHARPRLDPAENKRARQPRMSSFSTGRAACQQRLQRRDAGSEDGLKVVEAVEDGLKKKNEPEELEDVEDGKL